MRTSKFDRIIEELESLERVDEKFEYNKSQAISYLKIVLTGWTSLE